MKRQTLLYSLVMVALAMPVAALAQVTTLSLSVKGGGLEVDAFVDFMNNGEAVIAKFDILYDAETFDLMGNPRLGEALLHTDFVVTSKQVSPGHLRVIIMPPVRNPLPAIPNGSVVKVSFKAKGEVKGGWDLNNILLGDGDAKPISFHKKIAEAN